MEAPPFAKSLVLLLLAGCHHGGEGEAGASADRCPAPWLEAPAVDPSIAVPDASRHVVFHAAASGSQNYLCAPSSADAAGAPRWSFVGPEANLSDCKGARVGRHFASDGGGAEWQLLDGAYVVAHKVASSTPQSDAAPWLLLLADSRSQTGAFAATRYVQRVRTSGGLAPKVTCDASDLGAVEKVPYTAEYYFYGP
jgi:Protein of unknown function (DUF3455)